MSYWSLIASASLLVQLVMLTLLLLSVFSWFFIFERVQFLSRAARSNENFEERFWSGMDLTQLFRQVNANPDPDSGSEAIFRAGFKEFTRARQQADMDPEATMTAIQRAMRVATNKEEDKLDNHLSFLATVGSISPYIGLFGTVWGIMNSFRGLGNTAQATLATVAPGIAEALIATAMGLFAAIPAVVAYNRFSNRAESLIGLYETFSEEFSSILHRQVHALSRKAATSAPKARTESPTERAPKPLGDAGLV
ncbi:MAG: protein TolQ [Natronospirillum sp.]